MVSLTQGSQTLCVIDTAEPDFAVSLTPRSQNDKKKLKFAEKYLQNLVSIHKNDFNNAPRAQMSFNRKQSFYYDLW